MPDSLQVVPRLVHQTHVRPSENRICWKTVTAASKYAVVSAVVPVAALARFPHDPLSGGPPF